MDSKGVVYIVIAILTLGLLLLLQYNQPKEINWFPSYVSQHKIPYGTFVLNDLMVHLFPERIKQVRIPPFEFLDKESNAKGSYLFINESLDLGETELNRLLEWTSKGNSLFMASNNFERRLLDTLNLELEHLYAGLGENQSHRHYLINQALNIDQGFLFGKEDFATHFSQIDTTKTTVIGTVLNTTNDSIPTSRFDVIRNRFGEGEIILSSFPEAFTNYFILQDDNRNYMAGLLSYLDDSKNIYIDNHYKSGKTVYTSPMYVFLNTKEFKWAYYLVLIGVIIYIFFEGKRKQRPVPIIPPLKNQTLAFTRTIADMYYVKEEQKQIAEQKITNFLEYIRSHFHLGTIKREADFYANLASRSAHRIEEIQELFSFLERLRNQETTSNLELQKLDSAIEKFKIKAHGR